MAIYHEGIPPLYRTKNQTYPIENEINIVPYDLYVPLSYDFFCFNVDFPFLKHLLRRNMSQLTIAVGSTTLSSMTPSYLVELSIFDSY